ncbi:hypothetical protein [Kibdelosporangium phytohabitans]|uniref:Uncharacterized protein n=1 Tax=Kibdelosporangium phytohabitans TaxID=860235 RepID=A0A0N9HQS2_9PSEU|nr:hypothetical protein [Kibdelosporangium phytohabitans]ALG09502.1 hypothetical protein AOZ06_23655 [Kibdelosporangium phytohabitans]MBE1469197.1 hypothetical protein [Kibdelosporangium phytohabitans]
MTAVAFLAMVATALVTVMDSTAARDRDQPAGLPAGAALVSLPRALHSGERAEPEKATQASTASPAPAVTPEGLAATPYFHCTTGGESRTCGERTRTHGNPFPVAIAQPEDAGALTGVKFSAAEKSAYSNGSPAIAAMTSPGEVELVAESRTTEPASFGVPRPIQSPVDNRSKLPR